MAQKSKPTVEELFEGIGDEENTSSTASQNTTKGVTPTSSNDVEGEEQLAELASLVAPRTSTSASRPDTPQQHLSSTTASSKNIYTPTTGSGRSSEEKPAAEVAVGEAEITQKAVPPQIPVPQPSSSASGGGGSWWGGLSAMATAAVKQAEAAVREIQKNEEAQKWAEQVKGNVGALRGLGDDIRSRALPTFTNILHTIAPPISQHERLQIHITHDLVNYPSLDPLIYQTFSRVMSQVEGGDLLVIQRGSESIRRRPSELAYTGGVGGVSSGWTDGPWWRQHDVERSLGTVKGLVEGTKLVRVSAETYGGEFFAARGGIEEAAKSATQNISDSNPVRSSDIFLAIQAIVHTASEELFASGKTAPNEPQGGAVVVDEAEKPDEVVTFAIYLHDPIHNINFSTLSQSIPQKWTDWIDAKSVESPDMPENVPQLPEEILEIIRGGGVDPREWVAEWMEETLSLAVGVLAQRYVARRMGVGEGGIGRGKRRETIEESGGGEAARAL